MDQTQEYFIHLLSSHINNEAPTPINNPNWKELFRLGELHNLTGMLCLAIKALPIENRPIKAMTYFNQALGQTLQSVEKKQIASDKISKILSENKIKHIYVKGTAIRELYPVSGVRTSGDIDVIVEQDALDDAGKLLLDNGFELDQSNDIQYVLVQDDVEIELKSYLDHITGLDNNRYFNNFDSVIKYNDYQYILEPTYHLYYIIAHMLSHIKGGGAGIRQLMDVHVLIKNSEIDFNRLFDYFNEYNLTKSAMSILSLSNKLFSTPLPFDAHINDDLFEHLTDIVINGGVFGYANGNLGTVRLAHSINEGKAFAPIKAFIGLFIVSKQYLYRNYDYVQKHHILLPIAYFNRLFDAVFKRGKQNSKNIISMFNDNSSAVKLSELINELEI